jgi:hypothetical protein
VMKVATSVVIAVTSGAVVNVPPRVGVQHICHICASTLTRRAAFTPSATSLINPDVAELAGRSLTPLVAGPVLSGRSAGGDRASRRRRLLRTGCLAATSGACGTAD